MATIIRSQTISPEMPALATADQAMISQSQVSITKADSPITCERPFIAV